MIQIQLSKRFSIENGKFYDDGSEIGQRLDLSKSDLEQFGYSYFSIKDPDDDFVYDDPPVYACLTIQGDKISIAASEPFFRNGLRVQLEDVCEIPITETLTMRSILAKIPFKGYTDFWVLSDKDWVDEYMTWDEL